LPQISQISEITVSQICVIRGIRGVRLFRGESKRMPDLGKVLIVFGVVLVAVGLLLQVSGKIPWLGRLPGDIRIERENFSFYFPVTTTIVISVVLSLVLWLFRR
jgi:hypothetical protein